MEKQNIVNTIELCEFDFDQSARSLKEHPLYQSISTLDQLRLFMQVHVLAVWDFMGLLKALQLKLTCVQVPWTPSLKSRELTRMINEIVLGEESDLDPQGKACDHFSLYLEAMKEVQAQTSEIDELIDFSGRFQSSPELLYDRIHKLEKPKRDFLLYNLELSLYGRDYEIAAAFFYGREKLIPLMFDPIVKVLKRENLNCPKLIYYLQRHIELDGDEHSVLAQHCLETLCESSKTKKKQAFKVAEKSLELRRKLWDYAYQKMM